LTGIILLGIWAIFMGVALFVSNRVSQGRAQIPSDTLKRILRPLRMLAPDSFYRAFAVPFSVMLVLFGAVLVLWGSLS
jgi:hypothetical protein